VTPTPLTKRRDQAGCRYFEWHGRSGVKQDGKTARIPASARKTGGEAGESEFFYTLEGGTAFLPPEKNPTSALASAGTTLRPEVQTFRPLQRFFPARAARESIF
jgi:hypothetical protein